MNSLDTSSRPETQADMLSRRTVLAGMAALSATSMVMPVAHAAGPQLQSLPESDPAAKAVHYVADAARSKEAQSGANCGNCSLYGAKTDTDGTCTLFKGQLVKAAGWCNSWSGL